jgi:oligopeptide transport system permease protein
MASAAVLALIALSCLAGPWLGPALDGGHWFGTDNVGRDLFARTLEGGRISLLVGLLATLVSVVIGVAWGAVAGYFGGRVDALMMRAVDILHALPFVFLVILLIVLFGRHFALVFVAVGTINWLDTARTVRGQTLALCRREFVDAARLAGLPPLAIIRAHLVPNLLAVVIVCATLTVPQVILMESFLSFLGLGVPEPAASWGVLVNDGLAGMAAAPWALLFPGGFLAATLLCLNFLGDGLREALDPHDR